MELKRVGGGLIGAVLVELQREVRVLICKVFVEPERKAGLFMSAMESSSGPDFSAFF